MNKKYFVISGVVVLIAIGVVIAVAIKKPATNAQQIPDSVRFSEVKKLSKGTKPACLTDNKAAETAIKAIKQPNNMMSSFDLVMGTRIIDMPAGYTTTTVHSFDGTTAKGTNSYTDKNQKAFAGDLQSFNYSLQLNKTNNEWKVTSYIACNQ